MLTIHFAIQLALVLDIYFGKDNKRDSGNTSKDLDSSYGRARDWFQVGDASLHIIIVLCVFLAFDLVAISLILQLLFFH